MKVILLKDVKGVGKKDQIIEVKDGYASNYLIPNKMAVKYTDASLNVLSKQEEERKQKDIELKQQANNTKELLKNIVLEFKAKAGKQGKMIGSVTFKEISLKLKNDYNIEIDKRKFIDKTIVNAFGVTILKIDLYKGIIGEVKVHVSEE